MTRKDIEKDYEINKYGVIISPGKFEGEMLYVPYFWKCGLEGMAENIYSEDNDDVTWWKFEITNEDLKEFPELGDIKELCLWIDSNGFVWADTK